MKFNCLAKDLSSGLTAVSHALSTKGSLPVLSYVLIKSTKEGLSLSATNLELAITTTISAEVTEEGAVCAPGRLLTELASSITDRIAVETKENVLVIGGSNVKSKLNGIDAKEFPKLALSLKEEILSLQPTAFCQSLSQVIFSAATDESRPVLTGVLLEAHEDELVLVGVDGFRLSRKRLSLEPPLSKDCRLIIPARSLTEIGRLAAAEESLKIFLDGEANQVIFQTPHFEIASRLIEGTYPEYQKIIPASFISQAVLPAEEFNKSVKLASLFARDSNNIIKLSLNPVEGSLTLSANTPEIGENETKMMAKLEGEAITIAFNNRYLAECLASLKGAETSLRISGELSPGYFAPVGDESFFHIIMPVRVQE